MREFEILGYLEYYGKVVMDDGNIELPRVSMDFTIPPTRESIGLILDLFETACRMDGLNPVSVEFITKEEHERLKEATSYKYTNEINWDKDSIIVDGKTIPRH